VYVITVNAEVSNSYIKRAVRWMKETKPF